MNLNTKFIQDSNNGVTRHTNVGEYPLVPRTTNFTDKLNKRVTNTVVIRSYTREYAFYYYKNNKLHRLIRHANS